MSKPVKTPETPQKFPAADKNLQTWVVVADGRKARVFKRGEDGKLELLDRITSTRDHHLQHKPQHMAAIHPDDAAFISEVGDWLVHHSESGSFDKFTLVASSGMLPHFRKSFSAPLHKRMMREIDKDIAHLEDVEVCKELCDIMWV